jgi:hypothetical protein
MFVDDVCNPVSHSRASLHDASSARALHNRSRGHGNAKQCEAMRHFFPANWNAHDQESAGDEIDLDRNKIVRDRNGAIAPVWYSLELLITAAIA